jgi:DNA-binding NarL/FixJ family response regulator
MMSLAASTNEETLGGAHPAAKSRVFLVDDHAMFREGMRQLIDREPDLTVCGDVADADEAMREIRQKKPDLVIADISLSGTTGIDLIKNIKAEFPDLPVLVVSMHEESLYAERALRAGAMGYVMKQEPAKAVKVAIRKVLGGDIYLSDKMSATMLAKFMLGGRANPPVSPIETLSDRELEVFRMLGEGKATRQIAEELDLTIPTINSFRNRIKEKLNLKNSTELILHAVQWVREGITDI